MKFKRIEVKAFGGINPDNPILVDFTKSRWIKAKGDMGVNKTSLLYAILVACGQISHTSEAGRNFINKQSGKIDIDFDFVGKDRCNYHVRCTKSAFTLTYDGVVVDEPITKMKQLLGTVGVSPMGIKNGKVADIIKWLSSYTNKSPEEFEAQLRKLKDGAKEAAATRAAANKIVKANDEYLSSEPMAQAWEKSEKQYSKPVDLSVLRQKRDDKERSAKIYHLNAASLDALRIEKAELLKKISELDIRIEKGEKWIKDAAHFITDYDLAKLNFDTAAVQESNYNKWQEIKKKKAERDEAETIAQNADALEKDMKKRMADLRAEILPDIKGVELVTEDTHKDGVMVKEGLYVHGLNTAQMSETEWWTVVMSIWRKYKVKAVLVDNAQSLGSKGIEFLEKLHDDGAVIFTAEMDRKQKTLQIEYE